MVFGFIKDKLKKAVDLFKGEKAEEKAKPDAATQETAPVTPKEQPKPVEKTPHKKPEPKHEPKKDKKEVPAEQKKAVQPPKEIEKQQPTVTKEEPEELRAKPAPQKAPQASPLPPPPARTTQIPAPKAEGDAAIEKPAPAPAPVEAAKPAPPVTIQESPKEVKEEKLGFFGKLKAAVTTKKISRDEYEEMFTEFEMDLLENNVALEVVDKIREDLWLGISSERFTRFAPEKRVLEALKQSISELFMEPFNVLEEAKKRELYIIAVVGVNGSGKTTTLAKLAHYFKKNDLEPVLAAGDTFRAAAIQQLEEHADRIGVKIIKQQYGADAAAVAFDAIQYAKANKARVVLIDTAGRLHSNTNLMEELKKIVRVAKPDTTIFIGEATTGNDCVYQATQFQQAVDIDGIVLAKADVDERGGASISVSYVTKKPILFFGTGQTYDDLEPFSKQRVLEQLSFE